MQRRELIRGMTLAGVGSLSLGALNTAVAKTSKAGGDNTETAKATADFLAVIAAKDASFTQPEWHLRSPDQLAEARVMLMDSINHALDVWRPMDPARPTFMRFNWPSKKLLGDNPDAIYYETLVSADYSYRIRGNTSGATYTSFTVELERGKDTMGKLGATINDTEFETDKDGNFEIIVSAKPHKGNWLRLDAGAISIATRHYFELEQSVGRDQMKHIPMSIDRVDNPGPAPAANDASIAAGIRRATAWIDKNVMPPNPQKSPHWVSRIPNQLPAPTIDDSNENVAYAAKDNTYSMAPWVLMPDQALVITGRYPKCRFASLVLWNQFMQTLDYRFRPVSINRKQTQLLSDGSFKIILAHQDPGKPNWVDTEGRIMGLMFWRFLMAEEAIEPLKTEVVKFADL
jgi:hypothetical protein